MLSQPQEVLFVLSIGKHKTMLTRESVNSMFNTLSPSFMYSSLSIAIVIVVVNFTWYTIKGVHVGRHLANFRIRQWVLTIYSNLICLGCTIIHTDIVYC